MYDKYHLHFGIWTNEGCFHKIYRYLSPIASSQAALTVSQQRHLVSFVKIPSKISWTQVGSVLQLCCDPPFVVPAEETLLLLLTLLVLLCLSFSFSFAFSPLIQSLAFQSKYMVFPTVDDYFFLFTTSWKLLLLAFLEITTC